MGVPSLVDTAKQCWSHAVYRRPQVNICVSTQDAKLRDLCRDIFGQFTTQTWNIMICEGDHSLPEADLYIWDFESETALPDTPEWRSGTKLFLVHRMDLPAFRKQCSSPELSVL